MINQADFALCATEPGLDSRGMDDDPLGPVRARGLEVIKAGQILIHELVESCGADLVDEMLKLVTSREWAEIFSANSSERNSEEANSVRSYRNAKSFVEKKVTEGTPQRHRADSDLGRPQGWNPELLGLYSTLPKYYVASSHSKQDLPTGI